MLLRTGLAWRRVMGLSAEDASTAGRNGITTGRRKTFPASEPSSAGQDEMTVIREHSTATLITELLKGSWGKLCTLNRRPDRTSPLFP